MTGLGGLTKRIAETISERNVLAQEKTHYLEKVGQLQANFNAAKPSQRDACKEKLVDNQAKLLKVHGEHAALVRNVDEWTSSLDSDMSNVLTPTVLTVIRTQSSLHMDCATFDSAAIALMSSSGGKTGPARPKQLPEGIAELMAHDQQLTVSPAILAASVGGDGNYAAASSAARRGSEAALGAVASSVPQKSMTGHAVLSADPVATSCANLPPLQLATAAAAPTAADYAAPSQHPTLHRVEPFVAVADADWEGQAEGDLPLLEGALVLVFAKDEEGWWDARVSDESGLVPSNFCTVPPTSPPSHGLMVAVDDYSPDDPSELSFKKGAVLEILTPVSMASSSAAVRAVIESGWLLGRINGVSGFVPSTFLSSHS